MVELLSKGERTDVVTEIVEVRNCGSPEQKTTSCSAGTSNELNVSLSGGLQYGEGVVGSIGADVTTGLGIGRDSGESIELELPPSGSIYRYTIKKTYKVLAGKVLARSSSGKEQEAEYAFHASCSISILGKPDILFCEDKTIPSDQTLPSTDSVPMVLIPAGEFLMGSPESETLAHDDEKPQHRVNLDAYYIDIYEVTNSLYANCVKSEACSSPRDVSSKTRVSYYDNPDFGNYPVIWVDWNQARSLCQWRGARLPTEAEWEKAARGIDGKSYAWGDKTPDCNFANFRGCVNDTSQVGSYSLGVSPYSVFDMAGNVWEWVQDWYQIPYYASLSAWSNPLGPNSGDGRVLRGGSWASTEGFMRSAHRNSFDASETNDGIGFRCARTP